MTLGFSCPEKLSVTVLEGSSSSCILAKFLDVCRAHVWLLSLED